MLGASGVSMGAVGVFLDPFEADVQPELVFERLVVKCAGAEFPLVTVEILFERCIRFILWRNVVGLNAPVHGRQGNVVVVEGGGAFVVPSGVSGKLGLAGVFILFEAFDASFDGFNGLEDGLLDRGLLSSRGLLSGRGRARL